MGNKGKKKKRENESTDSSGVIMGMGFPFAPSVMTRNVPTSEKLSGAMAMPATPSTQTSVQHVPDSASSALSVSNIFVSEVTAIAATEIDSMASIQINKDTMLLIFSKSIVKYVSGVCNLSLLHGKSNINGYKMKSHCPVEVRNPVWMPAARLFVDIQPPANKIPHKQFVSNLCQNNPSLKKIQSHLLSNVDSSMIILLCEAPRILIDRDWMLSAEDWSPYTLYNTPSPKSEGSVSAVSDLQPCSAARLHMCLVGAAPDLVSCGLEYMSLPPDWVAAVDDVCKSIKTCPRTVLCGAKGVGK
jgi:hypothetical protein